MMVVELFCNYTSGGVGGGYGRGQGLMQDGVYQS